MFQCYKTITTAQLFTKTVKELKPKPHPLTIKYQSRFQITIFQIDFTGKQIIVMLLNRDHCAIIHQSISHTCHGSIHLCESSKGIPKQFWSHFRFLSTKGVISPTIYVTMTHLLQMTLIINFFSVPCNTVQSVPLTSLSPIYNLLNHYEATFQMFTVDACLLQC